jgi:hypothetical protein
MVKVGINKTKGNGVDQEVALALQQCPFADCNIGLQAQGLEHNGSQACKPCSALLDAIATYVVPGWYMASLQDCCAHTVPKQTIRDHGANADKMCTKAFLQMGCLINYLGPKDLTAAPLLQDSLCGPA